MENFTENIFSLSYLAIYLPNPRQINAVNNIDIHVIQFAI